MENIDFLKQILMSDAEYWVVAKMVETNSMGRMERNKDDIMLISIPRQTRRNLKYEEITLADLEKLRNADVDNIFLNNSYPPFQYGVTFWKVYLGFPITKNIRGFMIDALALVSDDIFEYKKLITEPEKVETAEP
jgi:hypothetical protein